ncbi:ankyrin repeat and LEM domain-containing protein 1-like [Cloeon dipterum]|uniref:ankyrin repeat and LEM domain-containing protein 1-like n=1 Tax=Cloeon dipterum TaxID=197152 RepID=UPI0032202788
MENKLLCAAIEQQDLSWATFLLGELNAEPNKIDPESGIAAIHLAVGMSSALSAQFVQTLLSFGADPNLRSADGCTPLHIAAGWSKTEIMQILLKSGADPDLKDSEGLTPMDYAVEQGNFEVLNVLRWHCKETEMEELQDQFTYERVEIEDAETVYSLALSLEDVRLEEPVSKKWCDVESRSDAKPDVCLSDDEFKSCVSSLSVVSQVFRYTDRTTGVSLIEKRLNSAMGAVAGKEQSQASEDVRGSRNSLVSISSELGYSSDHLSSALREKGAKPGPITNSTKAVYARQLARLKKGRKGQQIEQENTTKFSRELEKTLKDPSSFDPAPALALEQRLATEFTSSVQKGRELRGGHLKTSFTYLLLDPRVTLNLPLRAHDLGPKETWRTFIQSVFYVGKGKRSRPYCHLNEAIAAWKGEDQGRPEPGAKIKRILDIWKAGCGVVCLHVFHSVIPVEAHTREAAMIDAIGLSNLCNMKGGEYYGVVSTKSAKEQCHFGVHLLRNAMNIFLYEGERQLFPSDIS